jgi:hypothetical protein
MLRHLGLATRGSEAAPIRPGAGRYRPARGTEAQASAKVTLTTAVTSFCSVEVS